MRKPIAKCGCNCSQCPTYKDNLQTYEDRQRCNWGWKKYLNINLSAEKLLPCDGCAVPDENRKVYYLNCHVRKCAITNGIENCAYCSGYPCQEALTIHSLQKPGAREKIAERLGTAIPENDYLAFINPYEGIKHLNKIRETLRSEDIIEMKRFSFHPKIVAFPHDLDFSKQELSGNKNLYQILLDLEVSGDVSYAQQFILKKNRKQLLKILWTFGRYGELKEENDGSHLILTSEIYANQKIGSYYSKVQEYCGLLEKYGINSEIVPLQESDWKTPAGALRKTGWLMKLSVDEKSGGDLTINALKNYAVKLDEKYGKNAFRYFSKADMRVLIVK